MKRRKWAWRKTPFLGQPPAYTYVVRVKLFTDGFDGMEVVSLKDTMKKLVGSISKSEGREHGKM